MSESVSGRVMLVIPHNLEGSLSDFECLMIYGIANSPKEYHNLLEWLLLFKRNGYLFIFLQKKKYDGPRISTFRRISIDLSDEFAKPNDLIRLNREFDSRVSTSIS
jgi:hypothetical protein